MKKPLLILFATIFTFGANHAQIVLNELNMDNPGGADTQEFIELYGPAGASLDSLVLVLFDGTTDQSYNAFDLDGYSLDAFGFFVIGNANAASVDFVIPNASIQNGADGVGLFLGDAADYPNGTAASGLNMLDAAVYGTNDAADAGLITALGLDTLFAGYTQLDETAQQAGADLSLSRIPDGGLPYAYSSYVLQVITTGTWNLPPCAAGTFTFANGSSTFTSCDNNPSILATFHPDTTGYGDALTYVLVNEAGIIMQAHADTTFDLTGYAIGNYSIYSVFYNGDASGIAVDSAFENISATSCLSVSQSIVATLQSCGGCIGGTISTDLGASIAYCQGTATELTASNTSTSTTDMYMYVVADSSNYIVTTFESTFGLASLTPGNYTITGLSYMGTIDATTIEVGDTLTGITAGICQAYSSNTIALSILNCVETTPCTSLFFSEYLEGNQGTKALEIFNPTLGTVDLTGYSVLLYSNGATAATQTLDLTGTLAPLGTYVIANPGTGGGGGAASATVLALADITSIVANFSGNDAIELRYNGTVVDVIGIVGNDPGTNTGWAVGNASTLNNDLVRKFNVQAPTSIWSIASTQWDVFPNTDYTHLGNHSFQPCTDDMLIGFTNAEVVVNENAGTVTLTIQTINIQTPVTLTIDITNLTASSDDYITSGPWTVPLDGTSTTYSIALDVVDDTLPEFDESILFTLVADTTVIYTNDSLTFIISQNDPNCGAGFIQNAAGNGPVAQCSDTPNTPITINNNTAFPLANFVYAITDANGNILEFGLSSPVSLDNQGAGTFRVYGISFTGAIDPASLDIGSPIAGISADTCMSISNNFITINRIPCILYGCDGATVGTSDGSTLVTACSDGNPITLTLNNTSQSADASYTYIVATSTDTIISVLDGNLLSSLDYEDGMYHIFGVSYVNNLDATTTLPGLPVSGILADSCAELSTNFIELQIVMCNGIGCSQLYFSEYMEDSQANKAYEIYNPTSFAVDLSQYVVNLYTNGSAAPTATLALSGTLNPNDTYVVISNGNGNPTTDATLLAAADINDATAAFNGNDALELQYQGTAIDIIGVIGQDPGPGGWVMGNTSTSNHDLVRRPEVNSPTTDWSISSGQWISFDPTTYTNLGIHEALACSGIANALVSFTATNYVVVEDTPTLIVSVHFENSGDPFELTINATGTAASGADYGAIFPYLLNIPSGTGTLTFEISIVNDGVTEGDETILLALTPLAGVQFQNQSTTITIQDILGVNELNGGAITMMPNPCQSQLQLSANARIMEIQLVDMQGRTVLQNAGINQWMMLMDVSQITSGQYVARVTTEKGFFVQQLIIAH
jgi:hypothetical protein